MTSPIKRCKERIEIAKKLSVESPSASGREVYVQILKMEQNILSRLESEEIKATIATNPEEVFWDGEPGNEEE